MTRKSSLETLNSVATLLGGMLVIAALYTARDVFIPLTLAVLLSFLLSPLVNWIQRLGVGNVVAVLGTALFVFILLASTLTFVGRELSSLVSDLPHYKAELVSKARGLAGLRSGMGESFDALTKEVTAAIDDSSKQPSSEQPSSEQPSESDIQSAEQNQRNQGVKSEKSGERVASELLSPIERLADRFLPKAEKRVEIEHDGKTPNSPLYISSINAESPVKTWAGTVGNILGPLGTAGLVTVFVLFLLIYRDDMRDRIIKVISRGNYVMTTDALDEVSRRISKYLVAQTIVNTCYGLTFGLGLYLIGRYFAPDGVFPNFALWGALATMLRFVPYIGPVIATSFPILLSAAVFPGYTVTIAVISLVAVIELGSNNVLEPWLYGTSTGLSSVAIILAAVFWGWLWGPVGLLLSTPLTVCLVVLGRYVPRFRIFETLLGEKIDIAPSLLFYQRLLSNNEVRATELLETSLKEDPLRAIDSVLVPTLRRVRVDLEAERLTAVQAHDVTQSIENIVTNAKWTTADIAPATAETDIVATLAKPMVFAIPSHHPSEELLLHAFAQNNPQLSISVGNNNTLPDRFAATVVRENPEVIMIYVLPPGGFAQARYLCTTFRKAGYSGMIIVCCSGKFRNFDSLFVKFHKAGANFMTTSLYQTAQKLASVRPANLGNQSSRNSEQQVALASAHEK
ncbi:MAG: AI-2E family transporter [Pirellulaceae bacterium]|nr:AI-2E family transporter [Pirellulaceae bacterium]